MAAATYTERSKEMAAIDQELLEKFLLESSGHSSMSSTMLLLIIMLFTFMAGWQLTMGSSAIRLGRLWWKFPRQTMTWDIEHKLL